MGLGWGVDSRGMFTELVAVLSPDYLCVQFEYTRLHNQETWVDSYHQMPKTIDKVIEYVNEQYNPLSLHVVAHSMGCILAATQSTQFHKQIYLAPANEPMADKLMRYFSKNPHTVIDEDETVHAGRSDGTITHISPQFFSQLQPIIPLDQYAMTNGDILVVEAADDEVVENHSEVWGVLGNVRSLSIPGDHNFKPPHRELLIKTVVDYLRHE